MSKKFFRQVLYVLVIAVLLLGSFIAGRMLNKPKAVQAQEISDSENRSTFYCILDSVAAYENRMHVRCDTAAFDNVRYFAIESTSANEMLINRVMAIGLTNMSMNRGVWVYYDVNSANNPPGCNIIDCRKLTGLSGIK